MFSGHQSCGSRPVYLPFLAGTTPVELFLCWPVRLPADPELSPIVAGGKDAAALGQGQT